MTEVKRTWGLLHYDIWQEDYLFRHVKIKNPFKEDGRWKITLNERFLQNCILDGVHKIVVKVGEREFQLNPPPLKYLKELEKKGEVEIKPSLFENAEPMKLFSIYLAV